MWIKELFERQKVELVNRKFEPSYLKSKEHFEFYKENGYVIYRNVVNEEYIDNMKSIYLQISKMDGFKMDDLFVNSGRFNSSEIRTKAINEIKKISGLILSQIVEDQNCEYNNGGSFQIKPVSNKSQLNPHQDTPIVDEKKYYSIYVWIPLCNVNEENGTLSVLPKSHLWGNFQRSLNVPWIYEPFTKFLWKKMVPLSISKGDLICFDSALIHASGPNLSNETRVAFNTAILPKDFQQVHYYIDKDTTKGKVEEYFIDESFYMDENILAKPNRKFKLNSLQDWVGEKKITRSIFNQLLSLSSH